MWVDVDVVGRTLILPAFNVLKLKLWERVENLGKKTEALHRRGELKRFVITILMFEAVI